MNSCKYVYNFLCSGSLKSFPLVISREATNRVHAGQKRTVDFEVFLYVLFVFKEAAVEAG